MSPLLQKAPPLLLFTWQILKVDISISVAATLLLAAETDNLLLAFNIVLCTAGFILAIFFYLFRSARKLYFFLNSGFTKLELILGCWILIIIGSSIEVTLLSFIINIFL